VQAIFYLSVAADPGGQAGRAGVSVAGDQVHDLDGLLALLRDRAAQLRDLGGALEPDPGRRRRGLDGAAGPAAVVRAHGRDSGDSGPGQLFQLPVQGGHVALTVILSFRVSRGCDLRRPVVDSVADETVAALLRLFQLP